MKNLASDSANASFSSTGLSSNGKVHETSRHKSFDASVFDPYSKL